MSRNFFDALHFCPVTRESITVKVVIGSSVASACKNCVSVKERPQFLLKNPEGNVQIGLPIERR